MKLHPSNRRLDYGNSGTDIRYTVNLQALYAPHFDTPPFTWINGFEWSGLS